MAHVKKQKVFLTKTEAYEHQRSVSEWESPYAEYYRLGVSKCTVTLKDGSITTGWLSEWETYSG